MTLSIERRTPVLNEEESKEYKPDKLRRDWLVCTERMKEQILSHADIRRAFLALVTEPLSEHLPAKAMEIFLFAIDEDKRSMYNKLRNFLTLDAVPDDHISPDVSHASSLITQEEFDAVLTELGDLYNVGTPTYETELQELIDDPTFFKGITPEEKTLILLRYTFARDVKMLALQAELLEHPQDIRETIELPSGTTIFLADQTVGNTALLQPEIWTKREQIKDRVYRVYIGDDTYILKERKTNRHKDTQSGGHFDGRTSYEECIIGRDMYEHGTLENDEFTLAWEEPVGSVTYPDGFQFAVFTEARGLLDKRVAMQMLVGKILANRSLFENQRSHIEQTVSQPVDIHTFAKVYAHATSIKGEYALQQTILAQGYADKETMGGVAYRINQTTAKPKIEIFGFDYEYFEPIDAETQKRKLRVIQSTKERESTNLGFSTWFDGSKVTPLENEVFRALMQ